MKGQGQIEGVTSLQPTQLDSPGSKTSPCPLDDSQLMYYGQMSTLEDKGHQ